MSRRAVALARRRPPPPAAPDPIDRAVDESLQRSLGGAATGASAE